MDATPFGRYRLVELLGRGGMGEVWRAYDTAANNRMVAIKLLPSILASDSSLVQRFRREADAAARLKLRRNRRAAVCGYAIDRGPRPARGAGRGPLEPARAVPMT